MMVARTEDGGIHYIEVELNARLKRLREKIEEATAIPRAHQKVIFCHPSAFEELLLKGETDRGETLRKVLGCILLGCQGHRRRNRKKMLCKQIVHLTISHVRYFD